MHAIATFVPATSRRSPPICHSSHVLQPPRHICRRRARHPLLRSRVRTPARTGGGCFSRAFRSTRTRHSRSPSSRASCSMSSISVGTKRGASPRAHQSAHGFGFDNRRVMLLFDRGSAPRRSIVMSRSERPVATECRMTLLTYCSIRCAVFECAALLNSAQDREHSERP